MIANYHTHTKRCHHAKGEDIEYVHSAIKRNLNILGFSDHGPYIFDSCYYSSFRMTLSELSSYISSILFLKEKYKDKITIYAGLEVEYYPKYFSELINHLSDTPLDYIILGQHFLDNEINAHKVTEETSDEVLLKKYCYQIMEGMESGKFTYIAHPDVMRYVGDAKTYKRYMREVCRCAKQCGIPIELNILGMRRNRHYPNPLFWEVAAEEKPDVILGCDAHDPKEVADPNEVINALQYLKKYDIEPIETVNFITLR